MTACVICLSRFGKGISHVCTKSKKIENMARLIRSNSEKSKEQIVSSQLKDIFESQNIEKKGGTVSLSTRGTPIQATLGSNYNERTPKNVFTNDSLSKLQVKLSLSDNKMKIVGNFLRIECGRKSVVNLNSYLKERNHIFDEDFETKAINLKSYEDAVLPDGKKKRVVGENMKTIVKVKNASEFALKVMSMREMYPDKTDIQVGIDDGQGMVKVMLTCKERQTEQPSKPTRARYEEGFSTHDFTHLGVKKLVTILASSTVERHDNLKSSSLNLDLWA